MNATCPQGGPFTFRSIIYGRDLPREGMIWRIGDGSKINIHHDNWIPRRGSLKPLGEVSVQEVTKVCDLLMHSRETWNRAKVEEMFSADDARDILQTPVGGTGLHGMELH